MAIKGTLPLASRKQEYIDGLGNTRKWVNHTTCQQDRIVIAPEIAERNVCDPPEDYNSEGS